MKLLKILIILLVIVFPFGELLRFDIGSNIRFKPLDLLAGLISVWTLYLFAARKIRNIQCNWYLILFPTIALISLAVNSIWLQPTELLASGFYLIRWLCYLGIFIAVMQLDTLFVKKVISLFLLDGIIILVLGYLQFIFFSDLKPLYYLGWDDHMYRMFSVFLDPNYTGAFFVLYALFTGGLLYTSLTQKKIHAYVPEFLNHKQIVILLSSLVVLSVSAAFLTFSRSSLLMLIVGASVFFILIGRKKLILLLLGVLVMFTLFFSSLFFVENINLFRKASTNARLSNFQTALMIVQDHPVLGVGFNTYRYAKENYQIHMGWVNAPSHADAGVDNSWLFVLVTTGIAGFASYCYLWISLLKRALLLHTKQHNLFALIFISSSVGLFIHALFINSLFFPAVMLWMWLIAGLMENTKQ